MTITPSTAQDRFGSTADICKFIELAGDMTPVESSYEVQPGHFLLSVAFQGESILYDAPSIQHVLFYRERLKYHGIEAIYVAPEMLARTRI